MTEAQLYYAGSITIDEDILIEAGIFPGEKVEVLNINNGSRIETYCIAGRRGSGEICLNGPAARSGCVGDSLIILNYALLKPGEAKTHKTKMVYLTNGNKMKPSLLPPAASLLPACRLPAGRQGRQAKQNDGGGGVRRSSTRSH